VVARSGFERVSDFTPENRYSIAAQSVGRLFIEFGPQKQESCTATLIAKNLLLTARHCIFTKFSSTDASPSEAPAHQVWISFKDRSIDDPHRGIQYDVEATPLESDATLDYAVLRITGGHNPGERYRYIKMTTELPTKDEEFFILHHPLNLPLQLSRIGCRLSGDGDTSEDFRLVHLCNTDLGSSGASVMRDNKFPTEILAIHVGFKQSQPGTVLQLMTPIKAIAEKSCIVAQLVADPSKEPLEACRIH